MEGTPAPDVIVAVVDSTNLERNLYLVTQLLETGRPVVVALTMFDAQTKLLLQSSDEARRTRVRYSDWRARAGSPRKLEPHRLEIEREGEPRKRFARARAPEFFILFRL